MSPGLPVVSGHQVIAALSRVGFVQVSRRGSHVKLKDAAGRVVIVPLHHELAPGTLRSLLRQAGLSVAQLVRLLG